MKLVINRCYGGFSLSPRAVQRLAELNGQPCYFFKRDRAVSLLSGPLLHISVEEAEEDWMVTAYTVPNPNEVAIDQSDWKSMSMDERQASNASWDAITLSSRPENRADPKLVQVVEELGELANGKCAKLAIVEIPDDVSWEIDEYDGMERVEETHRSWS